MVTKRIITSDYWQERNQKYFDNLQKRESTLLKKLSLDYERSFKDLEKEVGSYYAKYGKDNVIDYRDLLVKLEPREHDLLIKDMDTFFAKNPDFEYLRPIRESNYKLDRLESLQYSIVKQQVDLGFIEEQALRDHLERSYTKGYNGVVRDMGFGDNLLFADQDQARNLVNTKWLNQANFSDRIWSNKKKLTEYMVKDFKDGVIRGDSYQRMGSVLRDRMLTNSRSNIKRLIYTEGTFVQNHAMAMPFEDMGYNTYIYDAIMDERTTITCQSLDGEEFLFKERKSGVNFPPMHVYCRSSFNVKIDKDAVPLKQPQKAVRGDKSGAGVRPSKTKDKPSKSVTEAYKSVELKGIDEDYREVIKAQLLDLQNKYPIHDKKLIVQTNANQNVFGFSSTGVAVPKIKGTENIVIRDIISFNRNFHKNSEVSTRLHVHNYKLRGSPIRSGLATFDHEYAHAIDNYYLLQKHPEWLKVRKKFENPVPLLRGTASEVSRSSMLIQEANQYTQDVQKALPDRLSGVLFNRMKDEYKTTEDGLLAMIKKELGDYASQKTKKGEFLAEGFSAMRHLAEEDKTEFVKLFERLFGEEYDKVIRYATS